MEMDATGPLERHAGNPIAIAGREVTLSTRFGPFRLSVKFPLKDMQLNGQLPL